MSEKERCEILDHCKWVDEIICPCPWVLSVDFLKERDIHYVAHDDLPYTSAGHGDIYFDIKKAGMFRATQRTEGISTSDIILRIIKDYDMYIERSIERGYDRKEIGISATKQFRVKLKSKIHQFKQAFKDNIKKQGGNYPSALRMFQSLESETEQIWHDFTRQFGENV